MLRYNKMWIEINQNRRPTQILGSPKRMFMCWMIIEMTMQKKSTMQINNRYYKILNLPMISTSYPITITIK